MEANEILMKAVKKASVTMNAGEGGPFGAAIIDQEGNLYVASNTVLSSNDPTAHAEVNAIRSACKAKHTHDLSGCVLYTTCYPCPMCLSACIWANIKTIYYGCTPKDAEAIGFRDDFIYRFIKGDCTDRNVMTITQEGRELTMVLFEEYMKKNGEIY
jgi:guanine deaminase